MKRLAIIHFMPLEFYPPVTNLISSVCNTSAIKPTFLKVFSSWNNKNRINYQPYNPNCKIYRYPFPNTQDYTLVRLLKYLYFNIITFLKLCVINPQSIVYFESYSAFPVYLYTKYINRKCKIFIHYHEYESKAQYANMMKTVRYYHTLEKKWLYKKATWISQTNKDRLQFFHQDHPELKKEQLHVMPNYPPESWRKEQGKWRKEVLGFGNDKFPKNKKLRAKNYEPRTENPIKIIYVGSLSFQATYLKEICKWILSQNGKVLFDIYAYNLYQDVKQYLNDLNSPYINFFEEGIEYNAQPKLLSQYDVGLILYKAHNQNYTYNAPNKLFEYLACDLDVWYPNVLQGPKPYITENTYPKVIPVDFENLNNFDWQKAIDKDDCEYKPSEYFCEEVYQELLIESSKFKVQR